MCHGRVGGQGFRGRGLGPRLEGMTYGWRADGDVSWEGGWSGV